MYCYSDVITFDMGADQAWRIFQHTVSQSASSTRHETYPTWKRTLGPIQKKQSTMRKANTMGMLFIKLEDPNNISRQASIGTAE